METLNFLTEFVKKINELIVALTTLVASTKILLVAIKQVFQK